MAVRRYKNLRGIVFNIAQGTGKPSIPITNSNIVELDSELAEKYPSWFEEIEEEKHPNIGQSFDDFVAEGGLSEEDIDRLESEEITSEEDIDNLEEEDIPEEEPKEEFDTYENIMSIAEKIEDVKVLRELALNYEIKLDGRKKLKGSLTQFKKELAAKFEEE